jgi:hypothetical protein
MTTATPRRPLGSLLELPAIREVHAPERFNRLPVRVSTAGILIVLVAISAFIRTRTLGGEFWFNEALATGIASHPLSALPGVLRDAGSSPLYYVVLHVWIDGFGSGETATHVLSLLCGLISIPAGMWAGWSLFGRRAGIFAAILFAFNAFLTKYAQDTQPYELMVLLGLLATAGFLHAFVYRRRQYLWLFAAALELMLYTQGTAFALWIGFAVALVLVHRLGEPSIRPGMGRDAAVSFAVVGVLYLPWLPTTIHQIIHATSPWSYTPLLGASVPGDLLGGQRVNVTLLIAAVVGAVPLMTPALRRSRETMALAALLAAPCVLLLLARISTVVTTGWASRYMAPAVAPLILLAALTCARARVVGVAAIVLCIGFLANPKSFAPSYKSDMRDIAAEIGPMLHPGDLVISGQPEQTPLAAYYLPGGLRYASEAGVMKDPSYMNWTGALGRLRSINPRVTLGALVATLKPGQQLLYVRPLTEGAKNWNAPWTQLVRRRAAQWGQILTADVAAGTLRPVTWAPHNYRGACCVADSAILYQKLS